jgi:hypothetical protein
MGQIPQGLVFKDSGQVKISEFTFWGEMSSAEMRQTQARSLAIMMDNIFRMIRGAQYEEGISNHQAVESITNTLVDGEKTVADLAEINDTNYFFWKENENA